MSRVDCKSHPLPDAETLRDRFAMAALTGLLACRPPHSTVTRKERAEYAYKYADAMIEARK